MTWPCPSASRASSARVVAESSDEMPGIIAKSNNIDLLVELAKAETVTLSTDGGAG